MENKHVIARKEFRSVQSLSCVRLFATPWTAAPQASCPSPTPRVHPNSCPLSWWCHPTISSSVVPFPPALNLSQHHGLFQWVSSSHQVAKVFTFNVSPSNEYSGLISFRMDWLDFLAVQGTLKSLLQHHSSKASVLWCSAFFSPTLTSIHDYWKNHNLYYTDLCWQSNVSAF